MTRQEPTGTLEYMFVTNCSIKQRDLCFLLTCTKKNASVRGQNGAGEEARIASGSSLNDLFYRNPDEAPQPADR